MTRKLDFSPTFNEIEKICKDNQCEHFIVWDIGYGNLISCKLQGESDHINCIAKNCPLKDKFKKQIKK